MRMRAMGPFYVCLSALPINRIALAIFVWLVILLHVTNVLPSPIAAYSVRKGFY